MKADTCCGLTNISHCRTEWSCRAEMPALFTKACRKWEASNHVNPTIPWPHGQQYHDTWRGIWTDGEPCTENTSKIPCTRIDRHVVTLCSSLVVGKLKLNLHISEFYDHVTVHRNTFLYNKTN